MPEQILYTTPEASLSLVTPDFVGLESPEPIYRYDDHGSRYYYTLDHRNWPTFGVSVTHLKDKLFGKPHGVVEKRIQMGDEAFFSYLKNRQHFGTFMHREISGIARNREYDFGKGGSNLVRTIQNYASENNVEYTSARYGKKPWFNEAWTGLMSWVQFMNDYDVRPLAVEISLMHPDGFANTIDFVVDMYAKKYNKTPMENRKRENAILDVKSGYIYPDHSIQLAFNGKSFAYHYKNVKIRKYYNWTYNDWWKRPTYDLRDQTDLVKKEAKLLDKYLEIYREKYYTSPRDVSTPFGKMVVGEDPSDNHSTIPIKKYIQQKHSEN